jgi:hypothetical protein
MHIKIISEKNNRDFRIVKNNETIIQVIKPKWYSSKASFFFNNKSYVIKKNSFWSLDHHIYQSGVYKGRIIHSWSGHYSISICKYKKEINRYTMSVEKPKGWFKSDTMYSILDKQGESYFIHSLYLQKNGKVFILLNLMILIIYIMKF